MHNTLHINKHSQLLVQILNYLMVVHTLIDIDKKTYVSNRNVC